MTEAEWLVCTDPEPMLAFLRRRASARKLRLFVAACCRRVWPASTDTELSGWAAEALAAAEEHADGQASEDKLKWYGKFMATLTAFDPHDPSWLEFEGDHDGDEDTEATTERRDFDLACLARGCCDLDLDVVFDVALCAPDEAAETAEQARLLREIVGNPFRSLLLDPVWRTPTAVALAQAAYASRELPAGTLDPARLAVLADALEEAGCDSADLLNHLRGAGVHVRGCWALDLILGRP